MTQTETGLLSAEARILIDAYHKGQHTSLLAEVDELSKRGSLSAGVLGVASASLVALERFDEALAAVRKAIAHEPQWAWLHFTLSRVEAGRGEWGKATDSARRAVTLMPEEPVYLANLSQGLRMSGQTALAAATARQALALEPANAEGLNQLGLALEAAGDHEGALSALRQAQIAHPNDPVAFMHEGELYRRTGRVRESRRAFQEALARNPHLTEAEDKLAESLSEHLLVQSSIRHLLTLGRLTMVGWAILAFLYYVLFRLLEFIWQLAEVLLPVGRVLLALTLVWLVGGALVGWLLRAYLHRMR